VTVEGGGGGCNNGAGQPTRGPGQRETRATVKGGGGKCNNGAAAIKQGGGGRIRVAGDTCVSSKIQKMLVVSALSQPLADP
jgi:hypothetical protein